MELGDKILARFFSFFLFGAFSVMLAMGLVMFDGPYRFGRFGFNFWSLHAASGLALIYSGMFGLATSGATEVSSTRFRMSIAWGMFVVIAAAYLSGVYYALAELTPVKVAPNWADYAVAAVVSATAAVAAYAYAEACKYFLRVHRLRAPYRRLLKESKELHGEE